MFFINEVSPFFTLSKLGKEKAFYRIAEESELFTFAILVHYFSNDAEVKIDIVWVGIKVVSGLNYENIMFAMPMCIHHREHAELQLSLLRVRQLGTLHQALAKDLEHEGFEVLVHLNHGYLAEALVVLLAQRSLRVDEDFELILVEFIHIAEAAPKKEELEVHAFQT